MDKDPMESWKTADVFPDPLWRGHYPGDLTALQEKTIEFLKNSVKLNAGLERGGGASSSSEDEMPPVWPEAVDFYKWCQPPSHEIWCHWNYKNPEKTLESVSEVELEFFSGPQFHDRFFIFKIRK